jgi:hypothetical protein
MIAARHRPTQSQLTKPTPVNVIAINTDCITFTVELGIGPRSSRDSYAVRIADFLLLARHTAAQACRSGVSLRS